MRQSLTQQEWDELDSEEQKLFIDKFNLEIDYYDKDYQKYDLKEYITIGQIWEVLENKIECIFAQTEKGTWVVDIKDRASLPKQFEDKEPIVALWKAYKFTLTI